jgi:ABC-type transporter Mla maintaining outer membrane lipid asymmetry ATPase subunit MlaF
VIDGGAAVVFDQVSKSFGAKQVVRDVSFEVRPGEALCVLGRSGTGKSVTLKLIVSLLKPDQGKMRFLFQDAALFDSWTLYENLALPLSRLTNKSPQEVDFVVDRLLGQAGLLNGALDGITTTVSNVNDVVVSLKEGHGTAGMLLSDDALANRGS